MKPLISYYGGKQRLSSTILEMMPDFKVFVEPFCGGAAVLFAMPPNSKRVEVLNDKDERIVTLYRVAKTQPKELLKLIDATPYSRSCHKKASKIWAEPQGITDLEVAWAVYVTIMQGFGNKPNAGWGFGIAQGGCGPKYWVNTKVRVEEQLSRLDNVYIECDDALKVIDRWDSKDTFFYVDPPYPNTECGHYKGYTLDDYKTLIDKLSTIKGKFLLSNYPQAVTIPEEWHKLEKTLSCHVTNQIEKRGNRTEVLYRNYDLRQMSFFDAEWDG
jgi:DNA adenine methylase